MERTTEAMSKDVRLKRRKFSNLQKETSTTSSESAKTMANMARQLS